MTTTIANVSMADKVALIDSLCERARILPVITIAREQDILPLADALAAGGLTALEVTLRSSFGLKAIRILRDQRPELVGVGHRDGSGVVGQLLGRRVVVPVDGDGLGAQALQGDHHLPAEFAGAEQHDFRRVGRQRSSDGDHRGKSLVSGRARTPVAPNPVP